MNVGVYDIHLTYVKVLLKSMIEKLIEKLIELFSVKGHKNTAIKAGIFLLVIFPIVAVVTLGYFEGKKNLTDLIVARRESIARVGAILMEERFNRLSDIATSLAARPVLRTAIENEKWEDARTIVKDVYAQFPFVEHVGLFSPDGTIRVIAPGFPGVEGVNFAHREWYTAVINSKKPYVSEMYYGATNQNTIVIVVPIMNEGGKFVGLLTLQIITDTLTGWSKEIDVGQEGFMYFVDRRGDVAGYSNSPAHAELPNFSQRSYVKRVMQGESGIEVISAQGDQREKIVSFAPVAQYNWGVIVEQPNPPAFVIRDKNLEQRLMINGLILIILIFSMYFIARFIGVLNMYRQRERIFLDSIGDGVVAIDRYWNITLWNKTAGELSGWSKEEAMGKSLREIVKFISEADRKENITFIEDALVRGKIGFMNGNTVLIRKDGAEVQIGDSAAPIFDKKGMVIGAIIIFRDVSQEREQNRHRSDLAYASHQLRTPVTKALWSLEAAKDKKIIEDMRREVDTAYQAMQSLSRLSDQLILVSKIDQKIRQVEKRAIKLTDLFDPSIKKANESGAQKSITVLSPQLSASASIITDQKLSKYIIDEVLDNAVKYSSPNGKVEMTAEIKNEELVIRVEDFGVGIMEEEKPLVFVKFFRGRNIDTTAIAGAGLGLYIAQEYAKLLGGKIWFEPKEKGTIFYISLPIA